MKRAGLQIQHTGRPHKKRSVMENPDEYAAPSPPYTGSRLVAPAEDSEGTGSPSQVEEVEIPTALLLERFEDELLLVSANEKEAYLEAIQFADATVLAKEADPRLFLMREANDVKAAAQRLLNYWTYRKDVFGDRAFRSVLNFSGNGAMTEEDLSLIRTGCGVMLPDDQAGRKVLCYDDDRYPPDLVQVGPQRLRCLFYWLTVASTATPLTQTGEIVILRLARSLDCFDHNSFEKTADMLETAMPVHLHAFHACFMPPKGKQPCNNSSRSFEHVVFVQMLRQKLGSRLKVHMEGGFLQKLQACGFTKEGLPTTLGGTWTYESFDDWLHYQEAEMEVSRHAAESNQATKSNSNDNDEGAGFLVGLAEAAERARIYERKARKRQMDAVYARKRRVREKQQEKQLQRQAESMQRTNTALQKDNERLEELLAEAKEKIRNLDGTAECFHEQFATSKSVPAAPEVKTKVDNEVLDSQADPKRGRVVDISVTVPTTIEFGKTPPAHKATKASTAGRRKLTPPAAARRWTPQKAADRKLTASPTTKKELPLNRPISSETMVNQGLPWQNLQSVCATEQPVEISVQRVADATQQALLQHLAALQKQDAQLHHQYSSQLPTAAAGMQYAPTQSYLQGLPTASLTNRSDYLQNLVMGPTQPASSSGSLSVLEQFFMTNAVRTLDLSNLLDAQLATNACLPDFGTDASSQMLLLQALAKASAPSLPSYAAMGIPGSLPRPEYDPHNLVQQLLLTGALNGAGARQRMQQSLSSPVGIQSPWFVNPFLVQNLAQSNLPTEAIHSRSAPTPENASTTPSFPNTLFRS